MDKPYIDTEEISAIVIYSDELVDLVNQVYKDEGYPVVIEHHFYNIKQEIFVRYSVAPIEQPHSEMKYLPCVLDDLCSMGYLKEGEYFIKQPE